MGNSKRFSVKIIALLLALCLAVGMFSAAVYAEGDTLNAVSSAEAQGEYVIPDGITGIGANAFKDCTGLTSVVIPSSVKSIGANAFSGCTSLANITFGGALDNVGMNAFTDTAWYKNYPTDYVYASSPSGFNLLVGYKGTDSEISIPVSTSAIGSGAFFQNENITSVVIPLRTETIGDYAFYGCSNLADVTVKGALQNCGYMAFDGTKWLDSYAGPFVVFGTLLVKYNGNDDLVLVPNTITKIASYAFLDCKGTTTVRVPASVSEIGPNAFYLFNDSGNAKYAEIYCWPDTYAEQYARTYGIKIAEYMNYPGDMNDDGYVQSSDGRVALRYAAKIDRNVSPTGFVAGDVDCDGDIDSSDARLILRMAAKIADYSPEDLLYKPNTPFEILMAYTEAMRLAYIKEAGYELKEYQEITNVDIGPSFARTVLNNPFKTSLTSEKKAKTQKLSADTVEALEKLYVCDLLNDSIIKTAKCVLTESNKYYITIVLNDEIDVEGSDSLTSCIFPVVDRESINKQLKDEEGFWYNNSSTDFNYRVTYTDCKLEAIVDVRSGNIERLNMTMNYKFDVWGQIILTKITNKSHGSNKLTYVDANGKTITDTVDGKYKIGTATRTDTVKYSEFNYKVPGLEFTTTTEVLTTSPDEAKNPVTVPQTTAPAGNNFLQSLLPMIQGALGSFLPIG